MFIIIRLHNSLKRLYESSYSSFSFLFLFFFLLTHVLITRFVLTSVSQPVGCWFLLHSLVLYSFSYALPTSTHYSVHSSLCEIQKKRTNMRTFSVVDTKNN